MQWDHITFEINFKFTENSHKSVKDYGEEQGLLDLDGRNSQKYLHQTWADF